jgi:hypothetical protein
MPPPPYFNIGNSGNILFGRVERDVGKCVEISIVGCVLILNI